MWLDIMTRDEMRNFGLSNDETQDYYLRHLGLLGLENHFRRDKSFGGKHSENDEDGNCLSMLGILECPKTKTECSSRSRSAQQIPARSKMVHFPWTLTKWDLYR